VPELDGMHGLPALREYLSEPFLGVFVALPDSRRYVGARRGARARREGKRKPPVEDAGELGGQLAHPAPTTKLRI
jgi:hypothetical protein